MNAVLVHIEGMGFLQSIIEIVQTLMKLGNTLMGYLRKKDFESPSKQILRKQII